MSAKKLQKVLDDSWKIPTFAAMKDQPYVITAISRLTGDRVEISGPMSKDMAEQRLAREIESRKRQRFPTYTRLRVERILPTQLTIQFNDL